MIGEEAEVVKQEETGAEKGKQNAAERAWVADGSPTVSEASGAASPTPPLPVRSCPCPPSLFGTSLSLPAQPSTRPSVRTVG